MTFGEKVMNFNSHLTYQGSLPKGIQIMNPFENPKTRQISNLFYSKYFNDINKRILILGINPGRFGAGVTGIPFTDTVRLKEKCGIIFKDIRTYEPSSSFIYEMIDEYGGVDLFYKRFLMSAVCPLGFTITTTNEKVINFNYYDNRELFSAVYPFIVSSLKEQIEFGVDTDICFCLGTGKNNVFLRKLNNEHKFFNKIIPLEHPRYIMQYKARTKAIYISKYIQALINIWL